MIVFDLRCSHGHVFEAWFRSSSDYENQRARSLIGCPLCNDSVIDKAVMAPNVGAKSNRRASTSPSPKQQTGQKLTEEAAAPAASTNLPAPPMREGSPSVEEAKRVLAHVAALQARMLEKSQWVGKAFVDRARAMHQGDEPTQLIHGQATPQEARELAEEGVAVAPLLVPIVPPEARN